ncbi:MAG TPA: ATP-dependent Clp protease adapter ClpS [Planctomycetota bacterium]|nr:ATP-dependent Clp protease adapter ClpS [Planctomycetota bacterium]
MSRKSNPPLTVEQPETVEETRTSSDRLWNVIVWNDPVNLMTYVTYVFQKLFGYSLEVATRLMLEVHHEGRSIVATAEREAAESHVLRLHQYGLQATLAKESGP